MPQIDLSDRSYERLASLIKAFGETPDQVLNRVLDEVDRNKLKLAPEELRTRSPRRAEGELLPEADYWRPILELLQEAGGSARGSAVIDDLGRKLEDRFTEADEDILSMGEVRWRNRARFARLRMKELGLISDESPRGIWEITPRGIDHLEGRADL